MVINFAAGPAKLPEEVIKMNEDIITMKLLI